MTSFHVLINQNMVFIFFLVSLSLINARVRTMKMTAYMMTLPIQSRMAIPKVIKIIFIFHCGMSDETTSI